MPKEKEVKNAMAAVVMISLALAIRQMSMTIVMPFISTYCKSLTGYTSFYAGLAVGIFGLMQAVFQIPFGLLSDRYGNKKIMLLGLTQVVVGLLLAYFAKSVGVLILARALQGSGAVLGVGYSWAAGVAGKKGRIRAMSILGVFVSAAAALAFAVGPLLRGVMSVSRMFLSCAVLLFLNEIYILLFIPDRKNRDGETPVERGYGKALLKNRNFILMNLAAFINNYLMISVFFAVPLYLVRVTGETGMWKVFLPAIAAGVLAMKPAARLAQKGRGRQVLMASFLVSSLSLLFYFRKTSYWFLLLGTSIFMCGYIVIATLAAANVNDAVADSYRGTANGIFNSFQYIGNFGGAVVTGALWPVSQPLAWLVTMGVGIVGFFLILCAPSRRENLPDAGGSAV